MIDAFRRVKADCLKVLLKPVARFCLKNALSLQDIIELAKVVLIDTAMEEMKASGDESNYSRISIMTGVHRKEVRRIHESGEAIQKPVNYLRQVIGQWEQDKRFLTKQGKPKILSVDGEKSEFKKLVRLITVDVNPAALLFELERLGLVKQTPKGLELQKGHLAVKNDAKEGVKLLARDIEDLVLAVEENLEHPGELRNLHGRTDYDNVYKKDVPKIRDWLVDLGTEFHHKAREYISKFDKDVNPKVNQEGGAKVVVATFSRITGVEEK